MNGWALLLLPIFLRALVPVGFMPAVGPDFTVRLVVCDGDGPMAVAGSMPVSMNEPTAVSSDMPAGMPAEMSMDMPAGMTMEGSASHADHLHHHGSLHHGICPYGSAPALGALPALAVLPSLLIQRSLEEVLATAQVAYVEVSPRAQSPRAPPV